MNEIVTRDGDEIADFAPHQTGGVATQIKTEIEAQIDRARRFPRSIARARENILSLATLDPETSAECVYALPRGNKPIRGPSIRLAEIIASQYGNCHYGGRTVSVDRFEKVVIAEGVFVDYETGLRVTRQVQRKISDRNGRLYSDDMIVVTGQAAAAIAMRNAILAGIPKPLWRQAYDACEQVLAGSVKTIVERRAETFKAFAVFGVTPEMIFETLEIEGEADLDLEEIKTLRAMYGAIQREEYPVEEYFPQLREAKRPPGKKRDEAPKGAADKLAALAEDKQKAADPEKTAADGQDAPAGSTPAPEAEEASGASADGEDGAKAEDAPGSEEQPAGESAGSEEQGAAPGDATDPASDASSDDALSAARKRGAEAFKNRMPLRAVPTDLSDNPALKRAFEDGWREAEKAG